MRSNFESIIATSLNTLKVPYSYESLKIKYIKPESKHIYTPDFVLPNGVIIEVKGLMDSDCRKKHLLIQKQYPELKIVFLFQNANQKISKKSKTTYSQWAEKHGFQWSHKVIKKEWLE